MGNKARISIAAAVVAGLAGNAFGWSAIAVDTTRRHAPYGFVVNVKTKAKAEQDAMAHCGGPGCKLLYSGDQKGWLMIYSSKPLFLGETGPVSFGYCVGAKDSQSSGNCAENYCNQAAKSVQGQPCGSGPFATETYGDGKKGGSKKPAEAKPADVSNQLNMVNGYLNNYYPVPNWDGSSNTQSKVNITKTAISVSKTGPYGVSTDTYQLADIDLSTFEFKDNIGSNDYARRIYFKVKDRSGQMGYVNFDVPTSTSSSKGQSLIDSLVEIAKAGKGNHSGTEGLSGGSIAGTPLPPNI